MSFRAWAIHRLELKQEESPSLFPNAADRGSVVHKALEALVKHRPSRDSIAMIGKKEIASVLAEILQPLRNRLPAAFVNNEQTPHWPTSSGLGPV